MANASLESKQIPVTTYRTEKRIVLTLSEEEAQALLAVTRKIGGAPKNDDGSWSVRGLMTDAPGNISDALESALGAKYDLEFAQGEYYRSSGMTITPNSRVVRSTR